MKKSHETIDNSMKNEVVSLLTALHFHMDAIPWGVCGQLAFFLKQNAHLGPAGTENIANCLWQMYRFVWKHLDDLKTPSFRAYMFQASDRLVSFSKLNDFYKNIFRSPYFPKLFSELQNLLSKKENRNCIYEYVFGESAEVLDEAQSVIEEKNVCEFSVKLTYDENDEIFYGEYYKEFLDNPYHDMSLDDCYDKLADYRKQMVLKKSSGMNSDEYDVKVAVLYYQTHELNYILRMNQKRLDFKNGMEEKTKRRAQRLKTSLKTRLLKAEGESKKELLQQYLISLDEIMLSFEDYRQVDSRIDGMKEELLRRVKNREI